MRRLILALAALVPTVVTPGDPIPDIDVTVEQIPPGRRMQTHTGADGSFSFVAVPANGATTPITLRGGVEARN